MSVLGKTKMKNVNQLKFVTIIHMRNNSNSILTRAQSNTPETVYVTV